MTKVVLAGIVLLSFTACDERVGRGIQAPVLPSMTINTEESDEAPTHIYGEEVVVVNDIPILEDDLSTLATEKGLENRSKISTAIGNSQGLDIANIRISNSLERTRVVFDSYDSGVKASSSGSYTYTYNPSQKNIILTLKGYSNISALGSSKVRTYPHSSLVKKISVDNGKDTGDIVGIITLRENADIKIFDIKEPGRIVVDISIR